jgi:hypothetical protein
VTRESVRADVHSTGRGRPLLREPDLHGGLLTGVRCIMAVVNPWTRR